MQILQATVHVIFKRQCTSSLASGSWTKGGTCSSFSKSRIEEGHLKRQCTSSHASGSWTKGGTCSSFSKSRIEEGHLMVEHVHMQQYRPGSSVALPLIGHIPHNRRAKPPTDSPEEALN
jgi:hypothetical protein